MDAFSTFTLQSDFHDNHYTSPNPSIHSDMLFNYHTILSTMRTLKHPMKSLQQSSPEVSCAINTSTAIAFASYNVSQHDDFDGPKGVSPVTDASIIGNNVAYKDNNEYDSMLQYCGGVKFNNVCDATC